MTDPEFLDLEDVLLIHEEQLASYGGSAGLRDQGLLESALGTPRATIGGQFVHEDLFAMAAAYNVHLAENQAFLDGNNRTGLGAALVAFRVTCTPALAGRSRAKRTCAVQLVIHGG